ncbi:MAG: DUF3160 domain-containing protein [Lachnospiraceae bacterium]|nr:DUF3160 domain-containing protein [Lachnospiraceae bacterium]
MICPNCKKENDENAGFCGNCGTKLEKKDIRVEAGKSWVLPLVIAVSALFVIIVTVICTYVIVKKADNVSVNEQKDAQDIAGESNNKDASAPAIESDSDKERENSSAGKKNTVMVQSLKRPEMIPQKEELYCDTDLVPSVPEYHISEDLSDVFNLNDIEYLPEAAKKKLAQDQFIVMNGGGYEFYDVYEYNRYGQTPNFVTVDSMMHTYHIYFSYLLKKTEKGELYHKLLNVSKEMYEESMEQYEELKGTEWEPAALMNVEYFAVANILLGNEVTVIKEADEVVDDELELIESQVIQVSPLLGDFEDYSQYKPRGYYTETEELEKYFKGMMWYGRRGFDQEKEDHMRSALLMTLAMDDEVLKDWEGIYTITSFFAGASDDNTYYEFKPLVDASFGEIDDVEELIGKYEEFMIFYESTKELKPPRINSIPVFAADEDKEITTFRFMGQRFSIDATVFQNLIYSNVEENSRGDKRMLPDALDIPAVLGSDIAYDILAEQGETDYKNYKDNLDRMKTELSAKESEELFRASLYAQWLNTLRPVLEEKGEGYPSFMQTREWSKKSVEGFLGSYTELKHDTILYSKQAMAEMGGGWEEEIDDRGYVEPEPVVYSRFAVLAENTQRGLSEYGLLSGEDKENLQLLAEVAKQLVVISEKELRAETLSEKEYDYIRDFGGDLEHIWNQATRTNGEEYARSDEHPGAIVADVATDPNGTVLELGTGQVGEIFVICPVDGTLRVCSGPVYSFYQFEWPLSDRLTDEQWRVMIGVWPKEGYEFAPDNNIKQPEWTESYRFSHEWN